MPDAPDNGEVAAQKQVEAQVNEVLERVLRRPDCDPPSAYEGVTKALKTVQTHRNRPLFVLISNHIDDSVTEKVYSWGTEVKALLNEDSALDILIHSPGGDLTASYAVARMFSRWTNSWEALVPALAASGATLICLGSSKVIMPGIARLSPVDPQVTSKRRERFFQSERQSPLEAFEAVRYLRRFCIESLDVVMKFLMDKRVTPQVALTTASTVALGLVEPMIGNVEAYDLGALALDSRIAIEYCRRISDPSDLSKKTQRRVDVKVLVDRYPAHEFLVDIEEAKSLDFAIEEPGTQLDGMFDALRVELANVDEYIGLVR